MRQITYLAAKDACKNVLHLQVQMSLREGVFQPSDTDESLITLPELGGAPAHFRRDQILIQAVTDDGQAGVYVEKLVAGDFSYLRCQLYRLDTETPTLVASVEYLFSSITERGLSSSFNGSDVSKATQWLDLSSRFIGEVTRVVE